MRRDPLTNAHEVIEAAMRVARNSSPEALKAAEREVERAIAKLALDDPSEGERVIEDALVEIAKLHVREKILRAA